VKATIRVLASPAVAAGFRLAGVPATDVVDSADVTTQLQRVAASDVGILLVEQSLFDRVPATVRAELERSALPLLVPIPSPMWEETVHGAEDYILDMLQRAIGYRVRLQ
jgi:vacuolar-type H+-ATPase subunit F/Vma7